MSTTPVKFELADGYTALRLACAGGAEVALDAGESHATDDAAEIAALDTHPAARRAPSKEKSS